MRISTNCVFLSKKLHLTEVISSIIYNLNLLIRVNPWNSRPTGHPGGRVRLPSGRHNLKFIYLSASYETFQVLQ
jgi:hypothetical protein